LYCAAAPDDKKFLPPNGKPLTAKASLQSMSFSISRNGSNLGAFPEEELRDGISTGRFVASDLAWREGMPEWGTVGSVLGLPPSSMPPPLPVSASSVLPPPQFQPQPAKAMGDDLGMRILLPVGRSGWAIAAGYLGLFCLVLIPSPIAIVVSIIALRDIKKSKAPGQKVKHGTGRAIFGLVAGIGGCLLMAYFALTMSRGSNS
jgi:hypothetical protein